MKLAAVLFCLALPLLSGCGVKVDSNFDPSHAERIDNLIVVPAPCYAGSETEAILGKELQALQLEHYWLHWGGIDTLDPGATAAPAHVLYIEAPYGGIRVRVSLRNTAGSEIWVGNFSKKSLMSESLNAPGAEAVGFRDVIGPALAELRDRGFLHSR